MFKRAYVIQTSSGSVYRSFPNINEAKAYRDVVFRETTTQIEQQDVYPNSRFINNRVLTVRQRHV